MIRFRRAAALAAVVTVATAGAATAQTVIVTGAPPASSVEFALNATIVGTTTADGTGTASLAVNLREHRGRTETDTRVVVDACDDRLRVSLVEPVMQAPPLSQGCVRRDAVGLFLVREVTTFVVYVGGPIPTVRVRQGPAPAAWLSAGSAAIPTQPNPGPTSRGLVLSGGGGLAVFGDPNANACGTVTNCSGKDAPLTYTAGATFWVTRFLAAEASYVKPGKVTASGSGQGFRFDTALETDVVTVSGKIGFPAGPARIYGIAGATYLWATTTTTESVDDQTVTIDDAPVTIPGGTQVFLLNTKGWGWLYGGGSEFWVKSRFALYVEIMRARLEGRNADGGEGKLNEDATLLLVGARFRAF